MEFSYPLPKQGEILGQFSNKWFHFVSQFQYFHFRQSLDETTKLSFLLHFGANAVQEIGEIHHLSPVELKRFSLFVEALENKCLFQIVITFFRYLFFNHCRKSGSWVEDFYAELKLLSEMCSFEGIDVDNFIKNHIINSLQEERVRNVFDNGDNLTAKDVIDICSKVEKHPGASTPELFQSYLFLKNHEKKSLQKSIKMRKDLGMTSFQQRLPEITKNSTLTIISKNDSRYNTDEVQKSDLVDNAAKLVSYSKVNLTQMDPQSDVTSYIPNKTPSLGVNIPNPLEGTSNFIRLSPPVRDKPTYEECTVTPSITLLWPAITSQKEECSKVKEKKGLEQYSTVTAVPDMSSSVDSSIVYTINTATSSVLTSDVPGTTTATASIKVSKCSVGENAIGSHNNIKISKNPKIKTNGIGKEIYKTSQNASEIALAYCSQQKVFLRFRGIGQSVDIYSCRFCVYRCSDKAVMEEHALHKHKSLTCFVCKACNIKSPSKEQLENHVRKKHIIIEEHKCQICDIVFTCQEELFSHLQDHAKTRAVSCRVSKYLLTKKFLSYHLAKLHPDRWSCRICNSGFSRRKLLSDHIAKVHQTKIRRFTCRLCGINFMDEKSLDMHKRKFHWKPKVRRFPCDLCSQICSSNANLIRHRRIHTGEKPYMCEVCGKRFSFLSAFNKHKLVHTGEKPYKCQYCERSFKISQSRHAHERIHRN